MPQDPAPMDQLRDEPLRFLETEQFQEMLSVYRKLKPLEQENPRKFRNQLNTYDFSDIYPIMDTYLQTRALSDPEAVVRRHRGGRAGERGLRLHAAGHLRDHGGGAGAGI